MARPPAPPPGGCPMQHEMKCVQSSRSDQGIVEPLGRTACSEPPSFTNFVPAGTPAPIVERLSKEVAATLQEPEVRARLEALGAEVVGSTPAELDAFRRAELAKWTRLAKDNRIQLD